MSIKIQNIKEAVGDSGIKALVHGPAGAGKTVLCATAGAPTLILSAEAGLLSIMEAPDYVKAVKIESIDDLEEVYEAIATGHEDFSEFEWICLDSISEIAEQVLSYEKEQAKDARQAYGNLSERMTKILRYFRDLPNKNVLMTCKQKRQTDEDSGITSYVPSLPGQQLTQGVSYMFDLVMAIRVEKDDDGEDYHILQCHRDRKYEAKDRSGALDMFEEPSLKKIAAKVMENMPEKTAAPAKEKEKETKPAKEKETPDDTKEEKVLSPKEKAKARAAAKKAEKEAAAKENSEAESETSDSEDELEEGYEIASEKMFWIHSESDSYGTIEEGEKFNAAKMSEQLAEIVSEESYNEFKEKIDAAESESESESETESDDDENKWICVECDGEQISEEEPTSCTTADCDGEDFYQE